MLQKQQDLTLVNRTGKLEVKHNSDDKGLYDIIRLKTKSNHSQAPNKIIYDLQGNAIACLDKGGNGTMFYVNKNRYVHFQTPNYGVGMTFIENGNGQLAVSLKDNNIAIYNNLNGKLIKTLQWHKLKIFDIHVNHLRNFILTASQDCVALWNFKNYQRVKTLFGRAGKFVSAIFSPNGNQLITLFQDGSVYFWNLDTFETDAKIQLPINNCQGYKIVCSQESDTLVIAGNSRQIYTCDIRSQAPYSFQCYDLPGACTQVQNMKFFKNGQLCLVGNDQVLYVSNVKAGNLLELEFSLPGGRGIIDFDINIRAESLALIASTGEIFIYDLQKLLRNQDQNQKRQLSHGIQEDLVKTQLKQTKQQKVLGLEENPEKENRENICEEVYVVQQGQPRTILKDSINQPYERVRDTNKLDKMYKSSQIQIGDTFMDLPKLKQFLKRFKQFPEKHRALIYKFLLKVPMNYECFDNLINKGLHNAFVNLKSQYPIDSQKLYTKMQRILSALAHYCPVFSEIDYIPAVVFPFVKMFGVDEVLCFEIILSFMIQWGQHLFEFFPNPPITMLQAVDDILKQSDPQLQQHLRDCDFGLNNYLWPPLQVLFTDMLSKPDWLQFIDFLMCYPDQPELLLYFVAAFFMNFRDALLKIRNAQQLDIFLHKQVAVNIQNILQKSLNLCLSQQNGQNLQINYTDNLPLTQNQYPIYNFYPQFTVDSHAKLRQQIQEEEQKTQQRQQQILELNRLTENLQNLENNIREKEEHLLRAEKDRRDMVIYEDEMRMAKKMQVEQGFRDQRVQHLTQLEKSMRNGLEQQKQLRDKELEAVAVEVDARKKIDNLTLQTKMEEEALQNLEYKSAARMNELIDLRAREERQRQQRLDMDFKNKQQDLHLTAQDQRYKAEDLQHKLQRDLVQQKKNLELHQQEQTNNKQDIQNQIIEQEFLRDMKLQEVERERKLRQIQEHEVFTQQEIDRLKQKQEQLLKEQDDKHIQAFIMQEKENALKREYERLRMIELEKEKQMMEFQEQQERLNKLTNMKNRQELEQKIIDIRREAQKRYMEEEDKIHKTILNIEEQKRVQANLAQDLIDKEIQYRQQQEFHDKLREREEEVINEEREKFEEFREKVRQEMGDNYPSKYQVGQQWQQQQLYQQQQDQDQDFYDNEQAQQDEILQRSQQLRSQIQKNMTKKIEDEYLYKQQQLQDELMASQGQQQPQQRQSVRFQQNPVNTQSIYSYSDTEEGGSRRSPFKNQQQQQEQMYQQYLRQSSGQKNYERYKPQQHYEDSSEDNSQQQHSSSFKKQSQHPQYEY